MFKFKDEDLLEYATIKDIYKYCNHYDLFRHYIGGFIIGKPMLSPLAPEKNPSFSIFVKEDGKVLFHDFRLGGGDIANFLMVRDGLTLKQAINKIVHDSGLNHKFRSDNDYVVKPLIKYNKKIEYTKSTINVKRRNWAISDIDFWASFNIGKDTLSKYRVSPIKYIFFNKKIILAEKYAYCFIEKKDNINTFTIYQPLSKDNKWYKSHDASVFYGWSQLPKTGDVLIITKSMKDVMTIDACMGTPTVALQSEKTKPKKHIIEELKSRFKNIYLLYDNDYDNKIKNKPNYGREFGKKLCEEFGLIQIEIPDHLAIKYKAKDLSDLMKEGGREYVCNILEEPHKFKI